MSTSEYRENKKAQTGKLPKGGERAAIIGTSEVMGSMGCSKLGQGEFLVCPLGTDLDRDQ